MLLQFHFFMKHKKKKLEYKQKHIYGTENKLSAAERTNIDKHTEVRIPVNAQNPSKGA